MGVLWARVQPQGFQTALPHTQEGHMHTAPGSLQTCWDARLHVSHGVHEVPAPRYHMPPHARLTETKKGRKVKRLRSIGTETLTYSQLRSKSKCAPRPNEGQILELHLVSYTVMRPSSPAVMNTQRSKAASSLALPPDLSTPPNVAVVVVAVAAREGIHPTLRNLSPVAELCIRGCAWTAVEASLSANTSNPHRSPPTLLPE